jgi:hypothetical protein
LNSVGISTVGYPTVEKIDTGIEQTFLKFVQGSSGSEVG